MSRSSSDDQSAMEAVGAAWAQGNVSFVVLFALLSVVGLLLSTGVFGSVVPLAPDPVPADSVRVPLFVYLYASLGALGYVFTKLMTQFEAYDDRTDVSRLAQLALRIPAAWVLGAGTYLLSAALLPPSTPSTLRFTAGFAFLVGLYVNVTMKSLGSLADRLLGRSGGA